MKSILKAILATAILLVLPLVSLIGTFGRDLYISMAPVALSAGLLYLGALFYRTAVGCRVYLIPPLGLFFLSLIALVFFSVSIGDWYVLPLKIMPNSEEGSFVDRYSVARTEVDNYLIEKVGCKGVAGHYVLSARDSMTTEGFKAAVRHKWGNMDSLSAAIVDTALIAVPWLIVWVVTSLFSLHPDPVVVYLSWWSVVGLSFVGIGMLIERPG